ncbi:MAG: ECF subfamily RNA polymerase sigma-24 factor [Candidatus Giovannonibacteria bacterium GW2011_GWA1_43_15]|uniref:ECF subfamily RNA polymerase sigma-24 factor n=3 Tax=Parcubacteria group TaxID=1794811 RepID=A0A0G1IWN4_9BACT|nr:MAG: ECF subfamily RNA polymerase sigma-24 factor [Candidatus Giovannonibacteria bacterium GW2011_GWB1_43_13]KKS99716.1 MAG: ECF subfamily RNA polymerase sigma-24 factor [Candidatus Giovannonibacteria bacterium GW2011_GWA1_43_15]KKT21874.1 MAG: ECF subfamily RNA polymerase sigma-24 factor [Candidatus Giovannonibacteria bacterium GW2011_GWC2_43_8]KKT63801.1 MAG: ECF subfamily RNA polymerase sigma-24 factor [Candidatus Giovannonibacteria bacterium GW2011_GWA2_44_26]
MGVKIAGREKLWYFKFINMYLDLKTNFADLADDEILKKSQDNPSLFSVLIDKYQLPFVRKAQGIVHSKEEAEDIVQETFTKIYLNAGKFKKQPGVEFKSWAWRILVNTSLTHYRKLKKSFGDVGYLDEILADDEKTESLFSMEDNLDRNENIGEVREAIEKMPSEAAELLRAHYVEDRPYAEIARKQGISIGALKMKLFRARKVLKDIMKQA